MNNLNIHRAKIIKNRLIKDQLKGKKYYYRSLIIESDGQQFTITLYGDNEKDVNIPKETN